MPLLEIKHLKKIYRAKKLGSSYKLKAVNDVSLSVEKNKCIGLVGESGCGKSTLGRLIVGLERPTEGEILFEGNDINLYQKKNPYRRQLQMVFQDSFDAVNPRNSARQIIAEPLQNFFHLPQAEIDKKIAHLLGLVGISENEKTKLPHQFSGGQLQRICIARSLAPEPKLLVLDEPLSGLDVSVQAQILNLLNDLKEELDLSYILISHDLEAVYYLADAIMVMYGGKIMEEIDDINYFHDMLHPYTLKLLSSTPAYRGKNETDEQEAAEEISSENLNNKEDFCGCPYSERCPHVSALCLEKAPELRPVKQGHLVACHNIKI